MTFEEAWQEFLTETAKEHPGVVWTKADKGIAHIFWMRGEISGVERSTLRLGELLERETLRHSEGPLNG